MKKTWAVILFLNLLGCQPLDDTTTKPEPDDSEQPGTTVPNPGQPPAPQPNPDVDPTPTPDPTPDPGEDPVCNKTIDSRKQLFMTDLRVVNNARTIFAGQDSPDGHWSFIYLMSQLKPATMSIETFINTWLDQWRTNQTVNGFTVAARPSIQTVLNDWPKDANGKIDLARAPFRLLSILFRPDLRNSKLGTAGEARFIFGVLDANGNTRPFTVIMEYALPISAAMSQLAWNQQIMDLGKHNTIDAAYLNDLQGLTDSIAKERASKLANLNAYVRVRSNEIALGNVWELRNFDATVNGLVLSPLEQTPHISFNNERSDELISWINDNKSAILDGSYILPRKFLAGSTPAPISFKWLTNKNVDEPLRKIVSENTCNSCHTGETNTIFLHVNPRSNNQESQLSPFVNIDLQRRKADLLNHLGNECK